MSLRLRYKAESNVPVEVEGITPDRLRGMSIADVERLEIFHGNRKLSLAEMFDVTGDTADERIEWEGELSGVHWIGAKMNSGMMQIAGNGGRHIGSEMSGGEIHVEGDAGDWVGGEMQGGLIHVRGRAGHLIGAAYRGSPVGMKGGTILVGGDAGNEVGHTMRRGMLAIGGNVGDLAGFNMLAGSVFIFGTSGIRHGAGMRRGTLGFMNEEPPPLLPSFRRACRYQPVALELIFRFLRKHNFAVPDELNHSQFDLYHGDMIEGGRGEILIRN